MLIATILTLAIIGFLVYMVTTYIPMPDPFRTIIYVITAVCVVLYLMQVFGVSDLPIPRVR